MYENIINSLDVKESTKKNYLNKYKHIVDNNIDVLGPEEDIIKKISDLDGLISKKSDMLTVIMSIRKHLGVDYPKLIKFKVEIVRKQEEYTRERNENTDLPDVKQLNIFLEDLYNSKEYKKYIINYLIIKFNTRNVDLSLTVSKHNKQKPDENYLIIIGDSVFYKRNNYKTVETYGPKIDIIEDPKFLNAVKEFLGTSEEKNLLGSSSFGQEIKNSTLNKIGTGKYFKALAKESGRKIREMYENRGTSAQNIFKYYV